MTAAEGAWREAAVDDDGGGLPCRSPTPTPAVEVRAVVATVWQSIGERVARGLAECPWPWETPDALQSTAARAAYELDPGACPGHDCGAPSAAPRSGTLPALLRFCGACRERGRGAILKGTTTRYGVGAWLASPRRRRGRPLGCA